MTATSFERSRFGSLSEGLGKGGPGAGRDYRAPQGAECCTLSCARFPFAGASKDWGDCISETMAFSPILGFAGTGIVAVAYIPQIRHLIKEHCSAGISVRAYSLWFFASVLFLVHASMIKDIVFVFVQVVNLAAICAVVICCKRYENEMCVTHLKNLKQAQSSDSE